jgi:hypothetical protein
MKAKLAVLMLAAASLLAMPQAVSCQDADLAGEWVTTNPRTRGITRIVVSMGESGWVAQTFGKCHPSDCDWGWVPLHPMGASVEDHSFYSGFAVWDAGFATKFVTMVRSNDTLTVEVVTVFKDRSRRANFRMKEVLRREPPIESN